MYMLCVRPYDLNKMNISGIQITYPSLQQVACNKSYSTRRYGEVYIKSLPISEMVYMDVSLNEVVCV